MKNLPVERQIDTARNLFAMLFFAAPWVLNCIFPVIKPLLHGRTLQKVQIFDSCPDKYLPAILDVVDQQISSLPSGFKEYNREMIQTHIIPTN